MKKIVLWLLIPALLSGITGCKKNERGGKTPPGGYYLRAKLNGVLTDFSTGAGFSAMGDDGKMSVIDLAGYSGVVHCLHTYNWKK
ncbi:hypothetical protein [Compostibacter hankyongensis]|uniref:Uncharacterized protein n=1 Tax=Compostibacter hankyongensis TaxID=1007089 RepID=A0ABP8G1H9_9BACT